jgi:hypothetical protein
MLKSVRFELLYLVKNREKSTISKWKILFKFEFT